MELKRVKIVRIKHDEGEIFEPHCKRRNSWLPMTDFLKGIKSDSRHDRVHLYFTTDEEIKEACYCIKDNVISYQCGARNKEQGYKKVIATTNTSFYYKDLPQPSQAFIEKYCELGGIDEIDVEYVRQNTSDEEFKIAVDKGEGLTKDLWYLVPKIDSHNTITIHPIKNSWNKEEVIELMESLLYKSPNLITQYPDDTVSSIKTKEFNEWRAKKLLK